jgi:alpha-D-ribose 1-methylphosphonate 5-triphosphate synthase subunit PhnL
VLEIRDLHKVFTLHNIGGRTVTALAGVSLDVGAGEHVALAGSSGAGKSSLLKCCFRTYLPTSGSIAYDGVELTTLADAEVADLRQRDVGYVSQFLRAEPRRGALDVVARAGVRRGLDPDRATEAAAESLTRLRLPEALWSTYPSMLSGGEQQRVNLAAATVEPPRLLLLDEPVSALDPANREAVLQLVEGLAKRGVAVLSVFHDHEVIERVATRVVLLRGGAVAASGAPAEVLGAVA